MERAREKIPRLDGEARGGEGGGCTTKDGEKRSLFYSGGARPAIWSYKINHSSSPAVGATRQINRSSASYELTRNFNPTSYLARPFSLYLSLSRCPTPISLASPLFVSHSRNKSFAGYFDAFLREAERAGENQKGRRTEESGAQCAALCICCTVLTVRGR